ncbi:LemA family protein [Ramlibacter tataouinensis]|uniref:LemA family protein n=1 Tax=Ramlibacter tataouinensis TaxID=94132 RepID=UPI0022F3A36B|nr:LemA family protein [Ramlibacter tataouinensis]WBY03828.1 LemA family protein [Ramlibacter tataouinensis]
MSNSILSWVAAAMLLFWAVGAYNRLVRLRGDAGASFAALDAELTRQVQLVRQLLPDDGEHPASLFDGTEASFWGGLQGAAAQLEAALLSARHKPLQPERIAALAAAQSVLAMTWERAEREDAHDLAGPRLPESLTLRRAHMATQCAAAAAHFTQSVDAYNQAIRQFPAVLLAWVFGFRPARGIEAMPVATA